MSGRHKLKLSQKKKIQLSNCNLYAMGARINFSLPIYKGTATHQK